MAATRQVFLLGLAFSLGLWCSDAAPNASSTWPQAYVVARDDSAGLLTLSTPYYTVQHALKGGGAISGIRLTHGLSTNLLVEPLQARLKDEHGTWFSDVLETAPRVSHRRTGLVEVVTVESKLLEAQGRAAAVRLSTRYEYHWGYVKIHREFTAPSKTRVLEFSPMSFGVDASLTSYGYREGVTEQEGAPRFSFGSCRWGRVRADAPAFNTPFIPRYVMLAAPGVEGLEWFVGSDLAQWDLQLTGRRGQGRAELQFAGNGSTIALHVSAFQGTNVTALPAACSFDSYIGLPLLEGHALKPWFHASFNRNRGAWVSPQQVSNWAEEGIQTVHCHNDGDYYGDGFFWRDGAYPPYPDMEKYNETIASLHKAGIRVATYFSNKELHPSTPQFVEHGTEWGRMDAKGSLQHNFFRGTNEFGAQMCLRSGWLDFLKTSIDRVLTNHPLDGVYYDWNVALLCCNPRHERKQVQAAGHWDIEELLNLMEWTRARVGPKGLVIVHNTTTPVFAMENFADDIVANEWGYGKWKEPGPALNQLPLEWSLVGARSRGVISYGQLDANSPRRLHRLFALEALLSGVTPWPTSPETFELFKILRPIQDLESFRFADWRSDAVELKGTRCASALYSRPGETYVLLANLNSEPEDLRCTVHPSQLPRPLLRVQKASLVPAVAGADTNSLDAARLTGEGLGIQVPGTGAVLLHLK